MDDSVRKAIYRAVEGEPFAQRMGLELMSLDDGRSVVRMTYNPDTMDNIYQRAHGGAVFALIDEAFETSCQTDGTVAVALNVSVTYITSPNPGSVLTAESYEVSRTKKTALYDIKVTGDNGQLVATCQALAYRTGKPIPFL